MDQLGRATGGPDSPSCDIRETREGQARAIASSYFAARWTFRPRRAIVVHVHDGRGAPVAGASLELVGPAPLAPPLPFGGLDLRTGGSSAARLPPFSAGTMRLRACSGERRGTVTEVVVVPDATAEARLLLPD